METLKKIFKELDIPVVLECARVRQHRATEPAGQQACQQELVVCSLGTGAAALPIEFEQTLCFLEFRMIDDRLPAGGVDQFELALYAGRRSQGFAFCRPVQLFVHDLLSNVGVVREDLADSRE